MTENLDLMCCFLNMQRVAELIGTRQLLEYADEFERISAITNDNMRRFLIHALFKDAIVDWLKHHPVPTIEELVLKGKAQKGQLFTAYGYFRCRGLSRFRRKEPVPEGFLPEVYSKIPAGTNELITLRVEYHPSHLPTESSWSKLQTQTELMILGYIESAIPTEIIARPFVMADLVLNDETSRLPMWRVAKYGELFVDHIDQFAEVRHQRRPRIADLEVLRNTPEQLVKLTFAHILGEETVPKDWGGERSDLFTTCVSIGGRRVSAAFAFKGPSQFGPMTIKALGKNGDQIDRLFTEPADLLVLQHCHLIGKEVRSQMRAYANQIGRLRTFCLIDGFDTLRVMKAYGRVPPQSQGVRPGEP